MFVFHGHLDAFDDGALSFGADLLGALECGQRHLEVMGGLLERGALVGLEMGIVETIDKVWLMRGRTRVACCAANFFKSSDPRFAIALVVSVKSCLWMIRDTLRHSKYWRRTSSS